MNSIKKLWVAMLGLALVAAPMALAQSPAYVTEAETAVTGLQTNVEGLLPEAFAIALVIFAGPFVWRFVRRFIK